MQGTTLASGTAGLADPTSPSGESRKTGIRETPVSYVVEMDIRGLREDMLDMRVVGNRFVVSGACGSHALARSFVLPVGANPDQVWADARDGVLTVNIHKRPEWVIEQYAAAVARALGTA